jgi:hypothetical protein
MINNIADLLILNKDPKLSTKNLKDIYLVGRKGKFINVNSKMK